MIDTNFIIYKTILQKKQTRKGSETIESKINIANGEDIK